MASRRNSYEIKPMLDQTEEKNGTKPQRKRSDNGIATPQEIAEKHCGSGISYSVKFVGTDCIDKGTPAVSVLSDLKVKTKHVCDKVSVTLSLSVKGLTMVEEGTKTTTKVLLLKIRNVCQHPDDGAYFAVILSTRESATGYQLYGFKADSEETAAEFVTSAKAVVKFVQEKISEKRKSWKSSAAGPAASSHDPSPQPSAGAEFSAQSTTARDLEEVKSELDGMMQYIYSELKDDLNTEQFTDESNAL